MAEERFYLSLLSIANLEECLVELARGWQSTPPFVLHPPPIFLHVSFITHTRPLHRDEVKLSLFCLTGQK